MATPEQEFFSKVISLAPTAPSEGGAVEKALEKGDPDLGTPVSIRNLFTHHDTHPLVMDFALLKYFGVEWWTWEAETIFQEVRRLFKSELSELARAKIQTVKTLHVTDSPWHLWHVFEKVAQGLNNNVPKWELMQRPTVAQLYVAIDIIEQIREVQWGDEVKLYMAACVLDESVFFVPPPLDFLQLEVSQPVYVCQDCHSEYSALFHDGTCDACARKFAPEQGLSQKPHPDAQGKGTNMVTRVTYDPEPIAAKWAEVSTKALSDVTLNEDDPVDAQIGKLLVARDYMNVRRRQLAEQLTNLKSWLGAS